MKLSSEPHNFEAFSYPLKIPQKLHKVKNFILKPAVDSCFRAIFGCFEVFCWILNIFAGIISKHTENRNTTVQTSSPSNYPTFSPNRNLHHVISTMIVPRRTSLCQVWKKVHGWWKRALNDKILHQAGCYKQKGRMSHRSHSHRNYRPQVEWNKSINRAWAEERVHCRPSDSNGYWKMHLGIWIVRFLKVKVGRSVFQKRTNKIKTKVPRIFYVSKSTLCKVLL